MAKSECVVVARLPEDQLAPGDLVVEQQELPDIAEGMVSIRVLAFTIGAGQRAGLQGSASYAGKSTTGIVMDAFGLGVVEESRSPDLKPGEWVFGKTGWRSHAVLQAGTLSVVSQDLDPAIHLGLLGSTGLTAYFGLLDVGRPEAGDTVLVSAAAGAVGHVVGQIARMKGCRTVGVTSSDEKGRRLIEDVGFDAFVNRKSEDYRDQFKAATPDRINIYFDNTGGDVLGSALFRMAPHGCIVCCGAVSAYDTVDPPPSPRGVPGLLVNNRVRMEGFLLFDYEDRYEAARQELSAWYEAGHLNPQFSNVQGLENAPQAFIDLLAGRNFGTTIVRTGS